jgi:hypothetical protein
MCIKMSPVWTDDRRHLLGWEPTSEMDRTRAQLYAIASEMRRKERRPDVPAFLREIREIEAQLISHLAMGE